jgi:hypothetical protein
MTTTERPAPAPVHSGAHRHTDRCHWDLTDARWRCPEGGGDRTGLLPALPRALVEPRRRPPARRTPAPTPPGRPVRPTADPGVDDGC